MLEYTKTILQKVSFNRDLFQERTDKIKTMAAQGRNYSSSDLVSRHI